MNNGKKRGIIVAPSILAADLSSLCQEVASVEEAGADWIHIDVMDGHFVPPITFGDNLVAAVKAASKLFCDVHLMVSNPESHIEAFVKAGSDRLIIHAEACVHTHRVLEAIRHAGVKNGIAVNPGTPESLVYPVLDITDLVLIMTVNPGWSGQKFISSCLQKVERLKMEIVSRNLDTLIEVDGGINTETGKRCIDAGADVLVSGSFIFGAIDRRAAIKSLRSYER